MGQGWFDNFSSPQPMSLFGLGLLNPPDVGGIVQQGQHALGQIGDFLGGIFQPDVSGQAPQSQPSKQQPKQQPSSLGDLSSLLGGLGGLAGGGGAGGYAGPPGYTTPDGVFINDNSPEDRYYKMADAVWSKVFGAHPDFAQAKMFRDMGVQNTDQLQAIVLQMPSHIHLADGTPINIGTYEDMRTTGQQLSDKYFGRPVPDTLIQQWAQGGMTTPAAIENWFYSHPATDIPPDQYGAIWDSANKWTQQVWGRMK